jgi:signal transduction histidine kinase
MIGRSLRAQIMASMIAMTLVMLALSYALFSSHLEKSTEHFVDQEIVEVATAIADSLEQDDDGTWKLDLPPEFERRITPEGDLAFAVTGTNGDLLAASQGRGRSPMHPFIRHHDGILEYYRIEVPRGGYRHGTVIQPNSPDNSIWVQVEHEDAANISATDLLAHYLLVDNVWIILPLFVVLLLANLHLIRRSLAPLRLASDRAAAIGPGSKGTRLPTENMPAEVLPLTRAANAAFDRLDMAVDTQKRFTGDAAHELLTPLAVLTARLDSLGGDGKLASIRRDVDAMTAVVTQLLEVAELDSADVDMAETVDLREICIEVVAMLAPLAFEQGKSLAVTGAHNPAPLRGSAGFLFRAVRNLVENAIAHTPEGTSVEVELQEDGTIRVIDDGPGIPAAQQELIFDRFWRGDRNIGRGTGLGLAIVQGIMEAHGGRVAVDEAPGGGAVFTLSFPDAAGSVPEQVAIAQSA